jgi:hypothetical protein
LKKKPFGNHHHHTTTTTTTTTSTKAVAPVKAKKTLKKKKKTYSSILSGMMKPKKAVDVHKERDLLRKTLGGGNFCKVDKI